MFRRELENQYSQNSSDYELNEQQVKQTDYFEGTYLQSAKKFLKPQTLPRKPKSYQDFVKANKERKLSTLYSTVSNEKLDELYNYEKNSFQLCSDKLFIQWKEQSDQRQPKSLDELRPPWLTKWEATLKDFNVWRAGAITYWKNYVSPQEAEVFQAQAQVGSKRTRKEIGNKQQQHMQNEEEPLQVVTVTPKNFVNFKYLDELVKTMKQLDAVFALGAATENNPTLTEYERLNFLFQIIRKEDKSFAKFYYEDLALFFLQVQSLSRFFAALIVRDLSDKDALERLINIVMPIVKQREHDLDNFFFLIKQLDDNNPVSDNDFYKLHASQNAFSQGAMKFRKYRHVQDKPDLKSVIICPEGENKSIFLSCMTSINQGYQQMEIKESIMTINSLIDQAVYQDFSICFNEYATANNKVLKHFKSRLTHEEIVLNSEPPNQENKFQGAMLIHYPDIHPMLQHLRQNQQIADRNAPFQNFRIDEHMDSDDHTFQPLQNQITQRDLQNNFVPNRLSNSSHNSQQLSALLISKGPNNQIHTQRFNLRNPQQLSAQTITQQLDNQIHANAAQTKQIPPYLRNTNSQNISDQVLQDNTKQYKTGIPLLFDNARKVVENYDNENFDDFNFFTDCQHCGLRLDGQENQGYSCPNCMYTCCIRCASLKQFKNQKCEICDKQLFGSEELKQAFILRQKAIQSFIATSVTCDESSQKKLFGQLQVQGKAFSEILKQEYELEEKAEAERIQREKEAQHAKRQALLNVQLNEVEERIYSMSWWRTAGIAKYTFKYYNDAGCSFEQAYDMDPAIQHATPHYMKQILEPDKYTHISYGQSLLGTTTTAKNSSQYQQRLSPNTNNQREQQRQNVKEFEQQKISQETNENQQNLQIDKDKKVSNPQSQGEKGQSTEISDNQLQDPNNVTMESQAQQTTSSNIFSGLNIYANPKSGTNS